MPVDPQFSAFLEVMNAAPPLWQIPLDVARASVMPRVEGPAVESVTNIAIAGSHGLIPARHYRPSEMSLLPLILYFHGGGFVIGDLDTHDAACRELCVRTGAALISVQYRLAPEHPFPAAPDDCLAALRWVSEQAAAIGIDASRIVVAGDSAGANLATVTSLRARDEGGPAVAGQVLFYPVTDHYDPGTASLHEFAEGPFLTMPDMMYFTNLYVPSGDTTHPHAFPSKAPDLSRLPPALIITAEFDPLRDEGEAYGERLRQAGGAVTISRYAGAIHGFTTIPGTDLGTRSLAEAADWIATRMSAL
jgi:acetyl esterase